MVQESRVSTAQVYADRSRSSVHVQLEMSEETSATNPSIEPERVLISPSLDPQQVFAPSSRTPRTPPRTRQPVTRAAETSVQTENQGAKPSPEPQRFSKFQENQVLRLLNPSQRRVEEENHYRQVSSTSKFD